MMFAFATSEQAYDFCLKIVKAMEILYDVRQDDALGLINRTWAGQDFLGSPEDDTTGSYDMRYHETYWYWAGELCNPNPYTNDEQGKAYAQRKATAHSRHKLLEDQGYNW